jgi:two-component system chemotaxis response regulator CheB
MGALFRRQIHRGSRIRVLVVDDSVVIRRLVTHALEEEPMIEVVGSAANGVIGLARIPQLNPDVITLDIEMPEMDGIEMLRRARQEYKDVRIIVFSTLTDRGAAATMEALSLGADDYVTKVSNTGSLDRSMAALRGELIPKIKQFFVLDTEPMAAKGAMKQTVPPRLDVPRGAVAFKLLVIGVSTGGPTALGTVLSSIPDDFPLPVLIVQHMPPLFTRLLAERLQGVTELKVEEAAEGAAIEPG